jgi:Ca2+-binding RTX toxin-like protein
MIIFITRLSPIGLCLCSLLRYIFQNILSHKLTYHLVKKNLLFFCILVTYFSLFIFFSFNILFLNSQFSLNLLENSYGVQYGQIDSAVQYNNTITSSNAQYDTINNITIGHDSSVNKEIPSIILPFDTHEITSPGNSYYSSSNMIVDGNNNIIIQNSTNNKNNYPNQIDDKADAICNGSIQIGLVTTASNFTYTIGANQYIPISGDNKDNYIIGVQGNSLICAKGGNDIVMTLPGNNIVYGGKDDDTIYGSLGTNQLFGEDGDDNIVGNQLNDLLVGGNGNDHLAAGAGDDVLSGGRGSNYFDCGDGIDTVIDYVPSHGDVMANNCEIVNNLDS